MINDLALMEYEEVYCTNYRMFISMHDFMHLIRPLFEVLDGQ